MNTVKDDAQHTQKLDFGFTYILIHCGFFCNSFVLFLLMCSDKIHFIFLDKENGKIENTTSCLPKFF